MKFIPEAFRAH